MLAISQCVKRPQPTVLFELLFLHLIALLSSSVFPSASVVATWPPLPVAASSLFYNQPNKLADLWAK